MARGIGRIIISGLGGFLLFLILLGIANILIPSVNDSTYTGIVKFFNANIIYLILLGFIGIVSEIFWSFNFPFNVISPIISAVFSYFIILFFSKFWDFLILHEYISFVIPFGPLYILIPLIVLVAGYLTILIRGGRAADDWEDRKDKWKERHGEHLERRTRRLESDVKELNRKVKNIDWEDVGDEFKDALYNLGKSINNILEEKGKKEKKKKKK